MEIEKIIEMLILIALGIISFFLREIHKDFRKMQELLQTLKEKSLLNDLAVTEVTKRVDKIEDKLNM